MIAATSGPIQDVASRTIRPISGWDLRKNWSSFSLGSLCNSHDDFDPSLRDRLLEMITHAYRNVGGYADYDRPDDLPGDNTVWLVLEKSDAQAVIFGKPTDHGIKWTGLASARDSKSAMLENFSELLSTPGNYSEVSGKVADHVLQGGPVVDSHLGHA